MWYLRVKWRLSENSTVVLLERLYRPLRSCTLVNNNKNSPMPMATGPMGLARQPGKPSSHAFIMPLNARQTHRQPSRPHPYPHRSPHTAHPCVACTANPGSSSSSVDSVCLVQNTSSTLRPALGRSARSTLPLHTCLTCTSPIHHHNRHHARKKAELLSCLGALVCPRACMQSPPEPQNL